MRGIEKPSIVGRLTLIPEDRAQVFRGNSHQMRISSVNFSQSPYRHASAHLATEEAKRLASLTVGTIYGIFSYVGAVWCAPPKPMARVAVFINGGKLVSKVIEPYTEIEGALAALQPEFKRWAGEAFEV